MCVFLIKLIIKTIFFIQGIHQSYVYKDEDYKNVNRPLLCKPKS